MAVMLVIGWAYAYAPISLRISCARWHKDPSAYPIFSVWQSGGAIDDLPVAAWLMAGAETKQGLERRGRVAAPVVAEDVLVHIGLRVLAGSVTVGAVEPR